MAIFTLNLYHDGVFVPNPLKYMEGGFKVVNDIQFEDNAVLGPFQDKKGVTYLPLTMKRSTWDEFQPILGMKFENPLQLKNALADYGVKHGYQLWFYRSDNKSLLVYCGRDIELGRCAGRRGMNKKKKAVAEGDKVKGKKVTDANDKVKGKKVAEDSPNKPVKWTRMRVLEQKGHHCPFRLWSSWMSSERSFQIKSLYSNHRCTRNYNMGSLVTFRWIARHYARDIILNSVFITSYIREDIREKYMVDVSLGQCKRAKQCALYEHDGGLIEHYGKLWEYRQAVLDSNPGSTCELLTVMGRDANNQMYPITWAIVDVENTNNWCWFLSLLADDLQLKKGLELTIISDSHKGLLKQYQTWSLPHVEKQATATFIFFQDFTSKMREIRALDEEAYAFLIERDPATWCKAYFQTATSCASFENGISEFFNAQILSARDKPIITMLEDIRVYIMQRIWHMSKKASACDDIITPSIRNHLEVLKDKQRKWTVFPSGYQVVEVRKRDEAYGVNLISRKCGCRLWNLSGCGHVGSTAMGSRSKRGGTARKGFDDSNNTEENQIIKDKDAMHEVMQDVMDEEERLHAEKEQRLDSEREHNGRIYQDWDQVSQDELVKGPTLSVLEAVDEAIQEHNDGLPSISEGQFHSLNQASGNSEHPISQPAPTLLETTTEESQPKGT
ncbi:calcium/proton exchanger [Tanacetum coccineum]